MFSVLDDPALQAAFGAKTVTVDFSLDIIHMYVYSAPRSAAFVMPPHKTVEFEIRPR